MEPSVDVDDSSAVHVATKRSAESPASSNKVKLKKHGINYSEEEEMKMVRYIIGRLPKKTSSTPSSWAPHAVEASHHRLSELTIMQFPRRSAPSYAAHYHDFRVRIERLIGQIQRDQGDASGSEAPQNDPPIREGSEDGQSVVYLDQDPSQKSKEDVEIFEIDSD